MLSRHIITHGSVIMQCFVNKYFRGVWYNHLKSIKHESELIFLEFSWLELAMIVCFGVSWPFNLAKSIRSRSTKGKSLVFLVVIFTGYIFGIANKLIYSYDFVIYAYIFNLVVVGADITMYFINRRREKAGAA